MDCLNNSTTTHKSPLVLLALCLIRESFACMERAWFSEIFVALAATFEYQMKHGRVPAERSIGIRWVFSNWYRS